VGTRPAARPAPSTKSFVVRPLQQSIPSDEAPFSHDVRRIFVDPKPSLVEYSRHLPDLMKHRA